MRAIYGLGLLGAVVAGIGGGWVVSTMSVPEVEVVVGEGPHAAARRHAARGPRAERRPAAQAPRPAPKLPPEERAEARELSRADQTDALLVEIEAHAVEVGWDDGTIAAVQDEFAATTIAISEELARVDRGEARWDEVKASVRQLRLDSAAQVETLLGEARFRALVADVGLERFEGESPIRGRIEAGRADARAAR